MTMVHEQAARPAASTASLVIALDRPETGRGASRVQAPGRVLRMWAVLSGLLPPPPASPGVDELRVECAGLLGWTGGLVLEILDQVQLAAAVTAQAAGSTERS